MMLSTVNPLPEITVSVFMELIRIRAINSLKREIWFRDLIWNTEFTCQLKQFQLNSLIRMVVSQACSYKIWNRVMPVSSRLKFNASAQQQAFIFCLAAHRKLAIMLSANSNPAFYFNQTFWAGTKEEIRCSAKSRASVKANHSSGGDKVIASWCC